MTTVKTVGICDTQPVTIAGLQSLLRDSEDLQVVGVTTNLFSGLELVRSQTPAVMIIDKAFGLPAVMDWLSSLRSSGTLSVVWGVSINQAEALRLMQAGAHGGLGQTTESANGLSCFHPPGGGGTRIGESLVREVG